MRAPSAWYQCFNGADTVLAAQRLGAIRDAGLELEARAHDRSSGPGLVFFDVVTRELCDFVRETSAGGSERVLAVASTMSAVRDAEWSLLALGASDLIAWDHSPDPASEISARVQRWEAVDRLVDSPLVKKNLVGTAPAWRAMLRLVVEVAHFTDASVLILGESGTGKELIARVIHALDTRPGKRDLVVLDCTTVMPELAGSEFFGHERGAFTGAAAPRDGAFALADGGTLFLDEVGDLRPALQAQLLRAIQERTYKRVGSNVWHSTLFRLLCATHRDLSGDVRAGAFRADLFYRIGGVVCHVPPLRERPEDIVLLFRHFARQYGHRDAAPELDDAVRQLLVQRTYPGNVRELQQLARRTMARHVGDGPITIGDIPDDERPRADVDRGELPTLELGVRHALLCGVGLKDITRSAAEHAIRIAIADAEGNLQLAARRLGVTDRALQLRRANGPEAGRPMPRLPAPRRPA